MGPKKSLRPKMRPERMEDVSPRAERGDIELMMQEEELRKRKRKQRMREYEPTEEEAGAIMRGNRAKRMETEEGFYRGGDVRYAYGGSVKARGTCY